MFDILTGISHPLHLQSLRDQSFLTLLQANQEVLIIILRLYRHSIFFCEKTFC